MSVVRLRNTLVARYELMATAHGVFNLLPVPYSNVQRMEDAERNRVFTPMIGYVPPLKPTVWSALSDHMRGVHCLVPEGVLFAWGCRCGARHEVIVAAPHVIAEPRDIDHQRWLRRAAARFAADVTSQQWLLNHECCGAIEATSSLLEALGDDFASVVYQWLQARFNASRTAKTPEPHLASFAPTADGGYDIWSPPIAALYPEGMSWLQACLVAQFGIRVWQRVSSITPSAVALLLPESAMSARHAYLRSSVEHSGPERHYLFLATKAHTFTISVTPYAENATDCVRMEGVERHAPWTFPMLSGFFAEKLQG